MKTFVLMATAVAVIAGSAPAQASVISLGTGLAETCYRAADARRPNKQAIQACDRALVGAKVAWNDRVATHVNRGILRMVSGNNDQAERDFDRALALSPNQPEAWLNKGIVQMNRGNSQAALSMIERAISLGTRNPAIAFYARGIAYEDSGNLKAAYADLQRARQLAPSWALPAQELQRYQVRTR